MSSRLWPTYLVAVWFLQCKICVLWLKKTVGKHCLKCQVKRTPKPHCRLIYFLIGQTGGSAATGRRYEGKLWKRLRARGHGAFFDSLNWRIQASTQVARGRLSAVRGDGDGRPRARRPQTPYVNAHHGFFSRSGGGELTPPPSQKKFTKSYHRYRNEFEDTWREPVLLGLL